MTSDIEQLARRIRQIREHVGLGRHAFAQLVGVSKGTLENSEMGKQRPPAELMLGIAKNWPQFALWLLTGKLNSKEGRDQQTPTL